MSVPSSRDTHRLSRLSWLVLAWNLAVILWGAFVRATGSGAGCGAHWPLCNGEVLPRAPALATMIEFTHRATSGIALLAVFYLAFRVFRAKPAGHPARRAAAASVLFILSEAAVGAGLVLFRLVADNESVARALFMAVHLMNTFVLLACLTLTAHWCSSDARPRLATRVALWPLAVGRRRAAARRHERGDRGARRHALPLPLAPRRPRRRRLAHGPLPRPPARRAPAARARRGARRGVRRLSSCCGTGRTPRRAAAPGRVAGLVLLQLLAGLANVALLAPVWMQLVHLLLADLVWIALVLLAVRALSAQAARA